jgi:hypothetical protein
VSSDTSYRYRNGASKPRGLSQGSMACPVTTRERLCSPSKRARRQHAPGRPAPRTNHAPGARCKARSSAARERVVSSVFEPSLSALVCFERSGGCKNAVPML